MSQERVISVIVPTYNRSKIVAETIRSLCQQELFPDVFEIIIVDNNSIDDTHKIVKSIICSHPNHNIRYIFEPRQGDYFARNRGAEEAYGKYLVFTDDDALFDENYLSTILHLFESYHEVGAVGTKIAIKWEGGTPAYWIKPYEYLLGALDYSPHGYLITTRGLHLNNGSLAIKRDLYIDVGGNNPGQIGDYLIGDAEAGLCRKLHFRRIPIAFTDETTMHHRQIVGKNDTISDIKRRVENNGIAEAYTDVLIKKIAQKRSVNKFKMLYMWYKLTCRERKALKVYFELCKNIKYNEYIQRFQYDQQLISLVKSTTYQWRTT